ncbi:hypothetical protein [Allohahella sp. A8]|uniref:hypothetical protein n=1 Tax=Allohahella sp. A8 TaxID=3141461 RepID=UPI003A7FBF06
MIKSLEHAAQIQQRRYQSGKRGRSKAVRSYVAKHHPDIYQQVYRADERFNARW